MHKCFTVHPGAPAARGAPAASLFSRRNNEDRAEVFERGDAVVVVVADGAGGTRGGADASDAVVAAVSAAGHDPDFGAHVAHAWMKVLPEVDMQLAWTMGGETTAVVAVVGPGGILGVSCGDCEAWVVTETGIDNLTARQNRKRLGSGRAAPVSFFRPTLDGTLVAGTDGLWSYAKMETMEEAVRGRSPAEAAEALRGLVVVPSGRYQSSVGTSPR